LDRLVKDHKLETVLVDVNTDSAGLESFVDHILKQYLHIDAVLFSSGVQHRFDFTGPEQINISDIFAEITITYSFMYATY